MEYSRLNRAVEKLKELRQKFAELDIRGKLANFSWRGLADKIIYSSGATKVVVGALLFGSLGGLWRHGVQRSNQTIKIAFSEIEKTVRECKSKGIPAPPITLSYSGTNEVCAKVFESHNEALKRGGSDQAFATEIETKMDSSQKVWKLIPEYAAELPGQIQEALKSMDKIVQAKNEMPSIRDAFDNAWTENHHNVYSTEYYSCDSDGDGESDETCSRPHYEYTIHTYTYYPKAGQQAAALLRAFVDKFPDLEVGEKLVLAQKTGADNEWAIWNSHRMLETGENPTQEQYTAYANTFATGSTFAAETPVIISHYKFLRSLCDAWENAMKTAKSDRYITYSSSDAGPKQFQICEDAQRHADNIYSSAREIVHGLEFVAQQVPVLVTKIKEYIHEYYYGDKDRASDLREEIMDLTADFYHKNFKKGMDITLYHGWMVVLFTALFGAGGAAAGLGAQKLAEVYDERNGGGRFNLRRRDPFGRGFSY